MKKTIRLTEGDLKKIVMEVINTTDINDLMGMNDTNEIPDGPEFEENNFEKIKEPTGNIKNCCDTFRYIMYAPHKDGEVQKTWNYMLNTYTPDELINGFKEFVKYYHR